MRAAPKKFTQNALLQGHDIGSYEKLRQRLEDFDAQQKLVSAYNRARDTTQVQTSPMDIGAMDDPLQVQDAWA